MTFRKGLFKYLKKWRFVKFDLDFLTLQSAISDKVDVGLYNFNLLLNFFKMEPNVCNYNPCLSDNLLEIMAKQE